MRMYVCVFEGLCVYVCMYLCVRVCVCVCVRMCECVCVLVQATNRNQSHKPGSTVVCVGYWQKIYKQPINQCSIKLEATRVMMVNY